MRVVFVEVDTERSWSVASIGPGFLAAYLREHGHEVGFVRATVLMSDAEVVAAVVAAGPDLLAFSLTTRQWLRAAHLVGLLRADPALAAIPVVAGGLHPTFAPEQVLATPGFDYACLGEGEEALLELATALETKKPTWRIGNLWKRDRPKPNIRAPFEPIDRLPFAARDVLDEPLGTVHMCTQRGCPFPCTYCAARMYNQLYDEAGAGEYGRRRSHDNVLAELHQLRDDGRLGYVIFLDDTFTINHGWVREFCRRYGEELHAPFSLHARVETVNEKMLHQLAAAGCQMITYGVESGSERVRREIMDRQVTNQRFKDVFRWTRDDLQQTLELAEELGVHDFGYFVFYPYPGTALFKECRDKGYLPEDYLTRPANHRQSILSLPDLTPDDIAEYFEKFTALRRRMYVARAGEVPPEEQHGAYDHVNELAAAG